ncbi:MAG: DUF4383 domain-containing protein [Solirubrobacterales bacterium]|nr:DUF4383 domain-containing protein [Solirubrobacterales bacterium]
MEAASPARLYATALGALLVVLGIVGFFYGASFGSPGDVEAALGVLRVNAWLNLLHVATGALGLLLAGVASRRYALLVGALYTALGIWGFAIGAADAIGGFLPASGGDDTLHLVIGVLGLAAAAGTPKPPGRRNAKRPEKGRGSSSTPKVQKEPLKQKSEPRAQPAGKRA